MARIGVCTHPLRPRELTWHTWDGPYIAWLERTYPAGFGGATHQSLLNGAPLAVADYDVVLGPQDQVTLVLAPAGAAVIITAIVGALVSAAINYVVGALFGAKPDKPKALRTTTPAPSSVYSLNTPRNVARLGDPVPVVYGRVLTTPDLASAPYSWYENNEQYIAALLCVGHGRHTIHGLAVSDTPAAQLAAGVMAWWAFQPTDHGQTFGVIQAATGCYENVDTSAEVADQELKQARYQVDVYNAALVFGTGEDADTVELPTAAPAGIAADSEIYLVRSMGVVETAVVSDVSVDRLTLTLSTAMTPVTQRVTREAIECTADADSLTATTQRRQDLLPGMVGRPVLVEQTALDVSAEVTDAQIDISYSPSYSVEHALEAPEGGGDVTGTISVSSTGDPTADLSSITIGAGAAVGLAAQFAATLSAATSTTLELVDADSAPAGECDDIRVEPDGWNLVDVSWTTPVQVIGPHRICAPGRQAVAVQIDIVMPSGLYVMDDETGGLLPDAVIFEITLTQVDDDGDPVDPPVSAVHEESIYAATNTPIRRTFSYALPVAGGYTATVQRLSADAWRAQNQSTAYYTGLKAILAGPGTPVYGDTTLVQVRIKATNGLASNAADRIHVDCSRLLDGTATSNPADIVTDLVTDTVYGLGRPAAELDADTFDAYRTAWASEVGFNGVFDQRLGGWEALRMVLQTVSAVPITSGGQLGAVDDGPRASAAWSFDASQIVEGSCQVSYQWETDGAPDGVEVSYRDPTTFAEKVVRYPADCVTPDEIEFFGCTDAGLAAEVAEREWNKRRYRRKWIQFETELAGHLPILGDRISVAYPLLGISEDYVVTVIEALDAWRVRLQGHRYDARVWPA